MEHLLSWCNAHLLLPAAALPLLTPACTAAVIKLTYRQTLNDLLLTSGPALTQVRSAALAVVGPVPVLTRRTLGMLQERGLCACKEQGAWAGAGQVESGSTCLCQPAGSEGYVTVLSLCSASERTPLPPLSSGAPLELDVVNGTGFGSLLLQSFHTEFLGNFPQQHMT